jgi:hypothetical protein
MRIALSAGMQIGKLVQRYAMKKPAQLDPLAEEVLARLAGRPEAAQIVLGGYFALKHYLDYRQTHDIDAWWQSRAGHEAVSAIEQVMGQVAAERGLGFAKRVFGDTMSFELLREKKRVFSFQIAVRSVELEPPIQSPWPPVLIETLADNIGAKMNALVDRGAPRDFADIRHVTESGLLDVRQCWDLWQRKNPGADETAAKEKVRLQLAAITARRPLESIADPNLRREAAATRQWFSTKFI